MKKILFCLLVIVAQLPYLSAQEVPIAFQLENYVNMKTGDLNYQVPLINISGPNGESFPLVLSYQSGVQVNQAASWVGLGWNLSLGEIGRNVKGLPDDWQAKEFKIKKVSETGSTANSYQESTVDDQNAYGPLRFKDFVYDGAHNGVMDLFSSWRKSDDFKEPPFEAPDYDKYYVSGPGIGGEMKPFLFDFSNLYFRNTTVDGKVYTFGNTGDATSYKKFSKEAQFRFLGDGLVEVKAPYYGNHNYWTHLSNTQLAGEDLSWTGTSHLWDAALRNPADVADEPENEFEGDYNPLADDRQRVIGGNYIEYFTNEEITAHYSGTTPIADFLDFQNFNNTTNPRGNASLYDAKGIGAFRVTTPGGMVYHYTLPVYVRKEVHKQFPFYKVGSNWTINRAEGSGAQKDQIDIYEKNDMYAESWKLTAITGPDFVDANANNYPDEGDKGYWVLIDYGKWNKDNEPFSQYDPYIGCHLDAGNQDLPSHLLNPNYHLTGSNTYIERDIYYPNYVKTQTQTVFLFKEIRKDGHSNPRGISAVKTPLLRLKRAVLLNNKDVTASSILQTYSSITSTDFTGHLGHINSTAMLNEQDYQSNSSVIDSKLLQMVVLEHDYHLAKGTYNNIDNTASSTTQNIGGTGGLYPVYEEGNSTTVTGEGGKLSLTALRFYGYNARPIHNKTRASYTFTYGVDGDNPNYDHRMVDYFGYYKKPKDALRFDLKGYTTEYSKGTVDAWSLKEIQTPLGGIVRMEYESDDYTKIGYRTKNTSFPATPRRYFWIDGATDDPNNNEAPDLTLNDPDAIDFFSSTDTKNTQVKFSFVCFGYMGSGTASSGEDLSATVVDNNTLSINAGLNFSKSCAYKVYTSSTGYIMYTLKKALGGGVRVKTIELEEPSRGSIYQLALSYEDGEAGSEPSRFMYEYESTLRPSLNTFDRFAAAPLVLYGKVNVSAIAAGESTARLGSKEYHFIKTSDKFSRSRTSGTKLTYQPGMENPTYTYFKDIIRADFNDYTNPGRLSKLIIRDKDNNLLKEVNYDYYSSGIGHPHSSIQEIFFKKRAYLQGLIGGVEADYVYIQEYSHSYLRSVTTKENDVLTTVSYSNFDKLSAQAGTIDYTSNSTPDYTINQSFAYHDYPAMGSKFTNSTYENRLGAIKSSSNNLDNSKNTLTNWSNSFTVLNLLGYGNYNYTANTFPSYRVSKQQIWDQTTWRQSSKATLFNEDNFSLESKDFLGNYNAVKIAGENNRVIARASNANYHSFVHSSFENTQNVDGYVYFDNDLTHGITQEAEGGSIEAHSGKYLAKVSATQQWGPGIRLKREYVLDGGDTIERGILPGRKYRASIWVHSSSVNESVFTVYLEGVVNNGNTSHVVYLSKQKGEASNIQVGDWIRMTIDFTVPWDFETPDPNNNVSVYCWNASGTGDSYFDDFRLQPMDATVEGLVYDEDRHLLESRLDNQNYASSFEYNDTGSKKTTYVETANGMKKVSETINHFAD